MKSDQLNKIILDTIPTSSCKTIYFERLSMSGLEECTIIQLTMDYMISSSFNHLQNFQILKII